MIKTVGTAASVSGSFILASNLVICGYCCFLLGSLCWLFTGWRMRDANIMLLNGFFLAANIWGLVNNLFI